MWNIYFSNSIPLKFILTGTKGRAEAFYQMGRAEKSGQCAPPVFSI